MEYRMLSSSELRAQRSDDKKKIEGYFAVFGDRYELWYGDYETISPTAFGDLKSEDVRALTDHDSTLVLGRTTAGTLALNVDDHGLHGVIEINEQDTDAVNLWARVQRGDVSGCSFGFKINRESYQIEKDASGKEIVHYILEDVTLFEVSVCTFPAYKGTSVTARDEGEPDDKRKHQSWKIKTEERIKKWHSNS